MAIDKRVSYEMQGHKKPARNYLGKQKTVKNIPIKWKSGPDAPATELAYITKAEKNLLLKQDLHGSLKHGPNTGPDGIMSLDSQGDYTRDRSPGAYTGGGGSPAQQSKSTGTSQQALRNRAMNERHMKEILTGQKDIGQTSAVSDRVRRGAVPEWVTTPSGKRKYVGSAYKSTGQQGWLSKLLGGSGYRGTVGTGSGRFFDKKSSIGKYNPATGLYESEEEDVGDIKPRVPFGLMGLIQSFANKFKKPQDMSQFNTLGATQTGIAGDSEWKDGALLDRWSQPPVNNDIVPLAKPNLGAGNFISNLNDPSNMASGMQMSNDQMTSMDNLINMYQNKNKNLNNVGGNDMYNMNADQANAMAASYGYNTGANQNNLYNYRADGGRIGYNRGRVVNPGGYAGDFGSFKDFLESSIGHLDGGVQDDIWEAYSSGDQGRLMDLLQIHIGFENRAQGGRAGYNRGRVVNPGGYAGEEEFEDENILEFMRDQNVPHSEMVEGEDFLLREEYNKYLFEMDELDLEPMSFEDFKAQAMMAEGQEDSFDDRGIASLV